MNARRFVGSFTAVLALAVVITALALPGRLLSLPDQSEGEWRDSPDTAAQAFCGSKYEVVEGICVDWWMSADGGPPENSGIVCCISEADKASNSFNDCIEGLR